MAKYSEATAKKVARAVKKAKAGKLRSGSSGKKVTSRKQAIAIGLSEARAEGKKVPELPKKTTKKPAARKTTAKKSRTVKKVKKKS